MRTAFFCVNVLGGIAVLGSYAHGLLTHPEMRQAIWGGVPTGLRPWYTVSMLLAAAGYFAFTYYVGFVLDPDRVRVRGLGRDPGFGVFVGCYLLVLAASAMWMPLTFAMIDSPGRALWIAIRAVLFLVAIGSIGILAAVASAEPRQAGWPFTLAVAGAGAFCIQTVLLDALVWPAYYPR